jgi:hypothetical protein
MTNSELIKKIEGVVKGINGIVTNFSTIDYLTEDDHRKPRSKKDDDWKIVTVELAFKVDK